MTNSRRSRSEHENIGLTSDKLEEIEKLNMALEEQWGRMEVARDKTMGSIEDELILTELIKLVEATGKAVEDALETSEQFIKERSVQISGAASSPAGKCSASRTSW